MSTEQERIQLLADAYGVEPTLEAIADAILLGIRKRKGVVVRADGTEGTAWELPDSLRPTGEGPSA